MKIPCSRSLPTPFQLLLPWLILCVYLLLILAGCSAGGGPSSAPVSVQVQQIQTEVGRARTDLVASDGALPIVKAMTPANVAAQKPAAVAKIESADEHLGTAAVAATQAVKDTKAIEAKVEAQKQQITALKSADPVRTWLNIVGIGAIVIGVGVLIASIFVSFLYAITWLRSASVGLIVFGLALVSVAHFLTAIYWMIGLTFAACVVGVGIWLWAHRTIVAAQAADLEAWLKQTTGLGHAAMPTPAHKPATTPAAGSAGTGMIAPIKAVP